MVVRKVKTIRQRRNKMISINKFDLFMFIVLICLFLTFFCVNFSQTKSFTVYFGFLLIGICSLYVLCFFKNFISAIKIFFCFVLVFFCIAPLQQYTNDYNAWSHTHFSDTDYTIANFLIITSIFLILLVYWFFQRKKANKVKTIGNKVKINKTVLYIFTIINLSVLIYEYLTGSLVTFENASSDSIMSVVEKVIRFIPAAILMLITWQGYKTTTFKILIVLNSLIFFIVFFPLSGAIPRFMLFGTYLIVFLPLLRKIKYNSFLPFLLIFGLLIVFPTFNFFKSNTIYELSKFDFFIDDSLLTVDFDAYQILMETIQYVSVKGDIGGWNLVTALLFFVPRGIWSGKMDPSGQFIAEHFKANFTNLSCPYVAEFYLAFGLFGVVIFSILIGYFLYKLDIWFNNSNNVYRYFLSIILISLLIYILRGALLPTVSYTVSIVISFTLVYFLYRFLVKIKV